MVSGAKSAAGKSSGAASERKLFKDWFDKDAAKAMAQQIASVYPGFNAALFERRSLRGIESLEFNDRVKQFSEALHHTLPESYPLAVGILVESLPEEASAASITDGWLQWPLGQFIADYGTSHFKQSMKAMIELTQRFSSEFAVRPFVEQYPEQTFEYLLKNTKHRSEHVRRWCSEGVRTRLPWGSKLHNVIAAPAPVFKILDALIDDESLYVRKSVANNLNDLAKDHPQKVLKKCRAWQKKESTHRSWIIRHGLRSLIKQGDPEALALTGFSKPEKLKTQLSVTPDSIRVNQSVALQLVVENGSKHSQNLMIDYVVHYVRKNNVVNEKVFKWKTLVLEAGCSVTIDKAHPMKQTTVRALYSGVHKLEVQVNGVRSGSCEFTLK